jgi:Tol biopolymer transport system component
MVSYGSIEPLPSAPLANTGGYELAVSPNGTDVVFLGQKRQGGLALYLKKSGDREPLMIPGTEMGDSTLVNPFFSWDGLTIGFQFPGKGIVTIPVSGGPPSIIISDDKGFIGAAWGPDNMLIMALARGENFSGNGLYRIPSSGEGLPERLTKPSSEELFYAAPAMLPGGNAVLFYMIDAKRQTERVAVFDLKKREQKILFEGGSNPQYVSSGHIIFARENILMAIPFDLDKLSIPPGATAVVTNEIDVRHPGVTTAADFAVSQNGTLVYVRDLAWSARSAVTPVWVDRNGNDKGPALNTPIMLPRSFQLSRNDSELVMVAGPQQSPELWKYYLNGHPPIRLADRAAYPIFYPDSQRIAFTSNRTGHSEVYSLASDGSEQEPKLVPTGAPALTESLTALSSRPPLTFLPDGRLVFARANLPAGGDILAVPATGSDKPDVVVETDSSEDSARVSPDGKWLAYRTNRTTPGDIWVQPLSDSLPHGAPIRVSNNGGTEPVWSRNGKELFYLEGNKMMTVSVTLGQASPFGKPEVLFERPYDHVLISRTFYNYETIRSYDVAADGRFLMVPQPPAPDLVPGRIIVVQNWTEELKKLSPAR